MPGAAVTIAPGLEPSCWEGSESPRPKLEESASARLLNEELGEELDMDCSCGILFDEDIVSDAILLLLQLSVLEFTNRPAWIADVWTGDASVPRWYMKSSSIRLLGLNPPPRSSKGAGGRRGWG